LRHGGHDVHVHTPRTHLHRIDCIKHCLPSKSTPQVCGSIDAGLALTRLALTAVVHCCCCSCLVRASTPTLTACLRPAWLPS
jgi:hypothetical protein